MTFRPDPKPEKREKKKPKPLNRRKKATGEKDLFLEIWAERPHNSFINGEPLGNEAQPFMFLHVLAKGLNKYPKFKTYKKNIVLGTYDQHFQWDNGSREELKQLPEWKKMFDLEAELKEEYKRCGRG